jgi:hypothetical protein
MPWTRSHSQAARATVKTEATPGRIPVKVEPAGACCRPRRPARRVAAALPSPPPSPPPVVMSLPVGNSLPLEAYLDTIVDGTVSLHDVLVHTMALAEANRR